MTQEYLLQVLCLLSIAAVPLALSKRTVNRLQRLALAMFPVVMGVTCALLFHETSAIFVALIGLWTVFFVMANRKKERKENDD